MARSTPDFFPINVMNPLLGGSFESRLNMNLRDSLAMISSYSRIVGQSPERRKAFEEFMASRSRGAEVGS